MASTDSLTRELQSPERAELIEQLRKVTGLDMINTATCAMLWFADIEVLRGHLKDAESGLRGRGLVKTGFQSLENRNALKAWLARPQARSEAADPADPPVSESSRMTRGTSVANRSRSRSRSKLPRLQDPQVNPPRLSPRVPRSTDAKDRASKRDNERCVLTKMGEPIEVCHIYPYSLGQKSDTAQEQFWGILGTFWSETTIKDWQTHIFGDQGTEVCQNMLTLNVLAHQLWGKARFALEPVEISKDRKTLTLRFWWLPSRKYELVRMTTAPSLPNDLESGPQGSYMVDRETKEIVRSGHEITMTTDDPETKPLPSFELLHMQWVLNRVAAMAGMADVSDDELDEDFEGSEGPVLQPLQPLELPIRTRRSTQPTDSENRPPARASRASSKVRELAETSDDAFDIVDDPVFH
ncbi:HNH endonuclease signature motif containing protein [Aspergillus lucknowensis]|uniref:HNH nuclease domain-containing protein n=1 Tax=Aspergillus lucknowensis TaxID=176173 RepID=A0ABR4M1A8_9EURO